MNNDKTINKLVLIPGISGRMGEEFAKRFNELEGYEVIGISSSKEDLSKSIIKCNLLNKNSIKMILNKFNFDKYSEIFIVHSIGLFLFEEENIPNIEELRNNVYRSNFTTFKNITEELTEKINFKKTELTLIGFGSISDEYGVPFWSAYSKSKIDLKKYIRKSLTSRVRGIFINVSSTEKDDERIYADKTYWLSCNEVSKKSMPSILNKEPNWQELDIFKINPDYYHDYFNDHDYIKEKWLKDMYGNEVTNN